MTQNNFSLLAIITRIVAADDVSGMVISLLLIGFGNELDISPEFFLVTFTMRGDEHSDGHSAYIIHEITP